MSQYMEERITLRNIRESRKTSRAAWLLILLLLAGGGGGGWQLMKWGKQYAFLQAAIDKGDLDKALAGLDDFSLSAVWGLSVTGKDIRLLYLKLSQAYLQKGENEKCVQLLSAVLRKFPGEPAFYANLAAAYANLGEHEKAVHAIEAMLVSPYAQELKEKNGLAYFILIAQVYFAAGDYEKAEGFLREAEAGYPASGEVNLARARLAAVQGDMKAMMDYYAKARQSEAQTLLWNDYFLLGMGFLQNKQIREFEQVFAEARARFPAAPGFHLLMSLKFLQEENYWSAYFEILFEKETGLSGSAYFAPAIAELEAQFEKAFAQMPQEAWLRPVFHFIQGNKSWKAGNLERALDRFRIALNQSTVHPVQQVYMGRLLKSMGRNGEAISFYGMAVTKIDNFPLALAELAELYLERDNRDAAVNVWERAVRANPDIRQYSPVFEKISLTFQAVTEQAMLTSAPQVLPDLGMRAALNQLFVSQFASLLAHGA